MPCLTVNINKIHSSNRKDKQDYYKVLGVNKNADQKEIKSAYYKVSVEVEEMRTENEY